MRENSMTPHRTTALRLAAASVLLMAAALPARAATLADGIWQGTWFPGTSCRDAQERRITATARNGRLQGSVENRSGQPGHLDAAVDEDGSFHGTVLNLQRYVVNLVGRAGPERITGSWTVKGDCGSGKFVLTLEESMGTAGGPPAAVTGAALGSMNERAALVQSLFDQSLITETEYRQTLARIGAPAPAPAATLTGHDARLQALDKLFQQGLITEEEYKRKAAEIGAAAD
jgi:hypothetical protein